jgi:hypothetical protein
MAHHQTNCPSCGTLLSDAPLAVGEAVKCPKCGAVLSRLKKKRSSAWVIGLLVVGGLLAIGCVASAVVGFIIFNKPKTVVEDSKSGDVDNKALVGKWEVDEAESRKMNSLIDFNKKYSYEFGDDQTATFHEAGKRRKGRWTGPQVRGEIVLTFTDDATTGSLIYKLKVIDVDHLELTSAPVGSPYPCRWRRIK